MESLLFHFLDDWLFKFSADLFFVPRVSVLLVSGYLSNSGQTTGRENSVVVLSHVVCSSHVHNIK